MLLSRGAAPGRVLGRRRVRQRRLTSTSTSTKLGFRRRDDPSVLRTAAGLYDAYQEHWNHIKFRKGWSTPKFTATEVNSQLIEAAETTAVLQCLLDDASGGTKLRQRGGNATAFLDTVDYSPQEESPRFVRDLVHQTLRDAAGYVEGLNMETVDNMLQQYQTFSSTSDMIRGLEGLLDKLEGIKRDDRILLVGEQLHKALQMLRDIESSAGAAASPNQSPKAAEQAPSKEEKKEEEEEVLECLHEGEEINSLIDRATKVTVDELRRDPESAAGEVDSLQERLQQWAGQLVKDVMTLRNRQAGLQSTKEDRARLGTLAPLLLEVTKASQRLTKLKPLAENLKRQREEERREEKRATERRDAELERERARRSKAKAAKANTAREQERLPAEHEWRQWLQTLLHKLRDPSAWQQVELQRNDELPGHRSFRHQHNQIGRVVIQGYLPGLVPRDVEVRVSGPTLEIKGVQVPEEEQVREMFEQLLGAVNESPEGRAMMMHMVMTTGHEKCMAELGGDRFGRFSQAFKMQSKIDPRGVRVKWWSPGDTLTVDVAPPGYVSGR
eukprot:Hpha_TRINITY_DN16209_c1_g13::TRINITY_DN16209_c1_g13_i1::g.13943::m.13943